jgi:hypothetical protein
LLPRSSFCPEIIVNDQPRTTPFWVVLSRVFWMLPGPLLFVLLLSKVVDSGGGWVTPLDAACLVVLGLLPLARWLEFRGGDPRTSTGEPATEAHLRKYVIVTLLVGLAAWMVAKLVRSG